jgi:protein involved in polysaccharide export with SLBB domain
MNWSHRAVAALLVSGLVTGQLAAQESQNRALATRSDLQALLERHGKEALPSNERQLVLERLEHGDFQPGDRILLRVREDSSLTDTFAVRTGQVLVLPNIPPVDLKGVLRSEVQAKLLGIISQYVRSPQVEVEPLIRLGLLGTVLKPGYYNVRADVPLSEVVMIAGGMTGDADFAKTKAQRGAKELHSKEEIRRAMAAGMSLDQLGIQGGDEIVVGRRSGGFSGAIPIIGALAATALAIVGIASAL